MTRQARSKGRSGGCGRGSGGPDTVVNLYLPPVTYEGELTISKRTVNLYGGAEGENQTTFTGKLTIETGSPEMASIAGIRFIGNGGTGLAATAGVMVRNCAFSGWDVGVEAKDGAWITPTGCTFSGNGVGLHFNSVSSNNTNPSSYTNINDLYPVAKEYVAGCPRYTYDFPITGGGSSDEFKTHFEPYLAYLEAAGSRRNSYVTASGSVGYTYDVDGTNISVTYSISRYTNRTWITITLD